MNAQFQQLMERKQAIYNYVARNFTQYMFDRRQGDSDTLLDNVRNYQEFIRQQGAAVNAADENTVIFLEQLMGVMPTISILDEETMVTIDSGGFYFDYGKIVFIASR